MKHNYNDNDDLYKEDRRVSNNMSLLRRNINQVKFGPQKQKRNQRGRTLPLNVVNLPGKKILPWGLMALRESDLNS